MHKYVRCIQSVAKELSTVSDGEKTNLQQRDTGVKKSLRRLLFGKLFSVHCSVSTGREESYMQYFPMLIQRGRKGVKSGSCASIECAVNQIQKVQRKLEKHSPVPGRRGSTRSCTRGSAWDHWVSALSKFAQRPRCDSRRWIPAQKEGGLDCIVRAQWC